jgi:hypothetical protein
MSESNYFRPEFCLWSDIIIMGNGKTHKKPPITATGQRKSSKVKNTSLPDPDAPVKPQAKPRPKTKQVAESQGPLSAGQNTTNSEESAVRALISLSRPLTTPVLTEKSMDKIFQQASGFSNEDMDKV